MSEIKWKTIVGYILILVLGISLAVFLYFYKTVYNSAYFLPGVTVASLNLNGYDQEGADNLLEAELESLTDVMISFYHQDYRYDTELRQLITYPDTENILQDVWEQEKHRSFISKMLNLNGTDVISYPVGIDYDQKKIDEMCAIWKEQIEKNYVDASLELDPVRGMVVLPAQKGARINVEATLAEMPRELSPYMNLSIKIVVEEQEPVISESDLNGMGEIASYNTWYNPMEIDRSHNLVLASNAINTINLMPGEVFSFNKMVGARTPGRGYRNALVIMGDKFEPGMGGGICQVSSTLYNACLLAGLKIVERHNHNLAVAYVPLGRDATVSYGTQDFRFQNNFNDPVYIWSQASNGQVTMKIYSNLKHKQVIKISHVVDQVIAFEEIRETKEDMEPDTMLVHQNGSPGYVVRAYRTFFDREGNVRKQEQLSRDRYRPLNRLIYEGPVTAGEHDDDDVTPGDVPVFSSPDSETAPEIPGDTDNNSAAPEVIDGVAENSGEGNQNDQDNLYNQDDQDNGSNGLEDLSRQNLKPAN